MKLLAIIALTLSLSACGVAQKAQYSALEKFGIHKRDVLVDRIEKTTISQEETKQQFQSAYEELAGLVKVDDQGLEKKYKKMAASVDKGESKAAELKDRIASVDQVANDLFVEWEQEIGEYTSANLKAVSQKNLTTTKQRYAAIYKKMQESSARVEPVLKVLQDNTLYLKHNLNARSVSGLSSEVLAIEDKVSTLIAQMEASINESKTFINSF